MKTTILSLALFLLTQLTLQAQVLVSVNKTPGLKIDGQVVSGSTPLAGTEVHVYKDGELVFEQVLRKHKFNLKLALNCAYQLQFVKEGYAGKKLEFSTHVSNRRRKHKDIFAFYFEVDLPQLDIRLANNESYTDVDPIGFVNYNVTRGEFEHTLNDRALQQYQQLEEAK